MFPFCIYYNLHFALYKSACLLLVLHYLKAVELSRMISLSSCTGAFLFYYLTDIVNWGIAIPVSLGSIAGSFIGLKIIPYIQTKWIQIILPIIFLFLIVQVVTDLIK
ncbi:TSUP family transporter [Lysinibacillus fusiformis]|nr:TSUP family transporter [Lysinibacillus fusiformis]PCD84956.1 anion permease [Lysinibacillus fusiformis]